jgi:hypothetical protein
MFLHRSRCRVETGAHLRTVSTRAGVAKARFDCLTCCRLITAGASSPVFRDQYSSKVQQWPRYSALSSGVPHTQRASTTLRESLAVTLQARGLIRRVNRRLNFIDGIEVGLYIHWLPINRPYRACSLSFPDTVQAYQSLMGMWAWRGFCLWNPLQESSAADSSLKS